MIDITTQIDTSAMTFEEALDAYLAFAREVLRRGTADSRCTHTLGYETLDKRRSKKFVRFVHWNGSQNSVFGFVRVSDGAILYPAGWDRPFIAKGGPDAPETIRGSIYDTKTWTGCTAWTGVRTIR
jgi:hypothetical protein